MTALNNDKNARTYSTTSIFWKYKLFPSYGLLLLVKATPSAHIKVGNSQCLPSVRRRLIVDAARDDGWRTGGDIKQGERTLTVDQELLQCSHDSLTEEGVDDLHK